MDIRIEIDQGEITSLMATMGKLEEVPVRTADILNEAAAAGVGGSQVQIQATTVRHSGELHDRWTTLKASAGSLIAQYWPEAYYASWIEYGTQPKELFAKPGKIMARSKGYGPAPNYFRRETASHWIFGTHVHHPGIKARPFIQAGVDAAVAALRGAFSRLIDEALK